MKKTISVVLLLTLNTIGCIGPRKSSFPDAYSAAADIDKWECPYCGRSSYYKEDIEDHMDRRH